MDPNRKQSSSGNDTLLDAGTQGNSDETTDISESESDLHDRFQLSLCVSRKPELKSSDVPTTEKYNSQSSGFKESVQENLSGQSRLKESQSSFNESSSKEIQTPGNAKIFKDKPSSTINKYDNQSKNVRTYRSPRFTRAWSRTDGKTHRSPQWCSNKDTKLNPSRHNYNVNNSFPLRCANPVPYQACEDPSKYPEQNLLNRNVAGKTEANRLQTIHSVFGENNPWIYTRPDRPQMKSQQWQVPPPNVRTTNWTVGHSSQSSRATYHNPMPYFASNATPIRHFQRSTCDQNPSFPVGQQVRPPQTTASNVFAVIPQFSDVVQGRQVLKIDQDLKPPASEPPNDIEPCRRDLETDQDLKPPTLEPQKDIEPGRQDLETDPDLKPLTLEPQKDIEPCRQDLETDKDLKPPTSKPQKNIEPGRQDLETDQDLKPPADLQPEKSPTKDTDNRNTSSPKRGTSATTKCEVLAKSTHYSKKNMLEINIPQTVQSTSYFPSYANPQGEFLIGQEQSNIIHFPMPSGSGHFAPSFVVTRGIAPHLPYQTMGSCTQTPVLSSFLPVVTHQAISPPAMQNNFLIHSVPNAVNPMHPAIQAQIMPPQMVQYQSATQNLAGALPCQDLNNPIYQYGTQYPGIQNIAAHSQNQDPNHLVYQYTTYQPTHMLSANSQYQSTNYPMFQYGTQYQPTHIQSANSQYQDPNLLPYQSETQYQDPNLLPFQSVTQYQDPNLLLYQSRTQYQDPNLAVNQHGTNSSETLRSPQLQWSYPTYDASIPFQQHNPNLSSMQTSATNPDSTSTIQYPTLDH